MKIFIIASMLLTSLVAYEVTKPISVQNKKHKKIFSNSQRHLLNLVRQIALTIPAENGETYEDTMAAICLTESSAGKDIVGDLRKDDLTLAHASLGHMQVRVQTALYVATKIKKFEYLRKLSKDKISFKLLSDIK